MAEDDFEKLEEFLRKTLSFYAAFYDTVVLAVAAIVSWVVVTLSTTRSKFWLPILRQSASRQALQASWRAIMIFERDRLLFLRGMQNEFLHAPVQKLGHKQRIL